MKKQIKIEMQELLQIIADYVAGKLGKTQEFRVDIEACRKNGVSEFWAVVTLKD